MDKILNYEEREKIKQEGWKIFHEGTTPNAKACGLMRVIDSHYWRQRENLEFDSCRKGHTKLAVGKKYTPGYVLDIDHYTPHWLYSMRHMVPKEVMEYIEENWGYVPTECEYLLEGNTIYTFGSRCAK